MTPYWYKARICRVVDGDSLIVDISVGFDLHLCDQSIRLYKVDTCEMRGGTDETKALAFAAKEYVERELPVGSRVMIQTFLDGRGKFGRLLASVFKSEGDGYSTKSINTELLDMKLAVEYLGQNKRDIMLAHSENIRWHKEHGVLKST